MRGLIAAAVVLFLAVNLVLVPATAAVATPPETRPTPDPAAAILTLNYLQASVDRISTSPNKLVLEREYETLLDNLNLQTIPDEEEIELIQSLMDTLVSARLIESERRQLQIAADARADAAMRDLIGHMVGLATDAASENPLAVVSGAAHVVVNYLNRDEEALAEKEGANLRLNDKLLIALNEFQKRAVKVAWTVQNRHGLPDRLRLTPEQIRRFNEAAKDEDAERRLRRLQSLSEDDAYGAYPPFWYQLASTHLRLGHAADAEAAYARFDAAEHGILRKDPYAAKVAAERTLLALHRGDREAALRQLRLLERQCSRADWESAVFASECYLRLGLPDDACRLVQANVDNGRGVTLSRRVLAEAMLRGHRAEDASKLVREIAADGASGLDAVYLAGRGVSDEDLAAVSHDLRDTWVAVFPHPVVGLFGGPDRDDELFIRIPKRWRSPRLRVTFDVGGLDRREVSVHDPEPDPDPKDAKYGWKVLGFQSHTLLDKGVRDLRVELVRDGELYVLTYDLRKAVESPRGDSLKSIRIGNTILVPDGDGLKRADNGGKEKAAAGRTRL